MGECLIHPAQVAVDIAQVLKRLSTPPFAPHARIFGIGLQRRLITFNRFLQMMGVARQRFGVPIGQQVMVKAQAGKRLDAFQGMLRQ